MKLSPNVKRKLKSVRRAGGGSRDDFVVLCRSAAEAEGALELIQQWVSENGLVLHPTKARIVDSRVESFAFLGYEFRGEKPMTRC